MNGPKTDHRMEGGPDRIDPRIRSYGAEVKTMLKELGFRSQQSLLQALPYDIRYTPETFRNLLRGRPDGDWFNAYQAIIRVFAERQMEMLPSAKSEGLEATENKIRSRVFGDAPPDVGPPDPAIAPSFRHLILPEEAATHADDFLDVKTPTLTDIAAHFDVPRSVYTADDGIRNRTMAALGGESANYLFTISGPSGSGKSVVSLRLAFDCLESGYSVYTLYVDWLSPVSLSHQIREAVRRDGKASLFIIDGAAHLSRGETSLLDVYKSLGEMPVPVVLLGVEAWRLLLPDDTNDINRSDTLAYHWSIGRLHDKELGQFVDHVINLELTNRVREVRCILSREARLALCAEDRDRFPATALLMFRYGRSVSEILVEEFTSLKGSFARNIYVYLITFAGLTLDVPRSAISRIVRQEKIREPDFWDRLNRVTSEKDGCVGLRHRLFFRYIAPHAIPSRFDRAANIVSVLLSLSDEVPAEDDFAQSLFGRNKPIANLLTRDEAAVRHLIQEGREVSLVELPEFWRSGWLTCLGRLSRIVLLDHETADACFSDAIRANPSNKFAHRERSWNLLHAGKPDQAEETAREAVSAFPSDVPTLIQSATVLQYTSEAGFDYAGELFEAALKIDPENDEVIEKQDRYEDAKSYRTYITKEWGDLEDEILERLRAPWFIWTVRKGVGSSRSNQAIKGKLGGLIRDPLGDIDEIREVAGTVRQSSDKLTRALISANLARAEYVQWYQSGVETDSDRIEKMFVQAMKDAPKEPFIRTWYGTFLKEVRKDLVSAEKQYRESIDLASRYKHRNGARPFENHPMLLNNLALLLIQIGRSESEPHKKFKEAENLLLTAIAKIEETKSRFLWPYEEYEELKRLKIELGIL